jgi:hypothetical protein
MRIMTTVLAIYAKTRPWTVVTLCTSAAFPSAAHNVLLFWGRQNTSRTRPSSACRIAAVSSPGVRAPNASAFTLL